MNPRTPNISVLYEGKDITEDISKYLTRLSIVDKLEGESDELTIELEDTDQLWISDWMPSKGDKLTVEIGYSDEMYSFGTFEIDEIEYGGPEARVSLKGVATGITRQLRTRKSSAHEGQTLKQIAEKIADLNGLSVEGDIKDVTIARTTQNRETDLSFLRRLASQYGYIFSVRDTKIIFTSVYDIQQSDPVDSLDVTQMSSWTIKDSAAQTASSATVSYHDPETDEDIDYTAEAGSDSGFAYGTVTPATVADAIRQSTVSGDTSQATALAAVYKDVVNKTGLRADQIQLRTKVENIQQAEEVANAALHAANSRQITGSVSCYGNPKYMAGANIELTGLRKLSGKFHIEQVQHDISRSSGYTCSLDLKKVGALSDASKEAPATVRIQTSPSVQ